MGQSNLRVSDGSPYTFAFYQNRRAKCSHYNPPTQSRLSYPLHCIRLIFYRTCRTCKGKKLGSYNNFYLSSHLDRIETTARQPAFVCFSKAAMSFKFTTNYSKFASLLDTLGLVAQDAIFAFSETKCITISINDQHKVRRYYVESMISKF